MYVLNVTFLTFGLEHCERVNVSCFLFLFSFLVRRASDLGKRKLMATPRAIFHKALMPVEIAASCEMEALTRGVAWLCLP